MSSFDPQKVLGWKEFRNRTNEEMDEHHRIVQGMPKFAIPGTRKLAKGEKVLLSDFWKSPIVTSQIGFVFPRFHQLTGSCVGAGGGNALFSLIAVQATLQEDPTKAIIPWWPLDYGRSRQLSGMRGRGEGSSGSGFAKAVQQGVLSADHPGLPQFQNNDGLVLTEKLEMAWSDGAAIDPALLEEAKHYPVGTAAPINGPDDTEASIVNGYPITLACDDYVGHATIKGTGDNACVVGKFDNQGGHQTSIQGVWIHPDFGRLFLYQNNWPASVYPTPPDSAPVCSVWLPESEMARAWGGLHGEVYALSHLTWFAAQTIDWIPGGN